MNQLKAAETLHEEHEAQLINYLKVTKIEVGLLLNFGKKAEFNDALQSALDATEGDDRIVELKYVFFETGSDQLTLLSRFELDNVVDAMVERPNLVAELGGHTDNTGSEETNLTVSQNRAESVKTYLVENGIEADRVNTRGYGQSISTLFHNQRTWRGNRTRIKP